MPVTWKDLHNETFDPGTLSDETRVGCQSLGLTV